jgi:hypothetical protein
VAAGYDQPQRSRSFILIVQNCSHIPRVLITSESGVSRTTNSSQNV